MHTFQIGENDAGQRADKFLLKVCPELPKSLLYKTFRKRDVKRNGSRISAETMLSAGDTLTVYLPDDCFGQKKKTAIEAVLPLPEIVYEDAQIVVMKKPVNLPVHADDRGTPDTMAARFLQYLVQTGGYDPAGEQSFSPALCNRLDRNTEGLVIGAKTAAALRCMNEKIRCGEVIKQYLCIAVGQPPEREAVVDAFHRRKEGGKAEISPVLRKGFRPIRTGYAVENSHNGLSLLRVRLYTGRTHQIRAQMAALGCPLLGDAKYGDPAVNRFYHAPYQMLAACSLEFHFSEEPCVLSGMNGLHLAYIPDFCAQYGL